MVERKRGAAPAKVAGDVGVARHDHDTNTAKSGQGDRREQETKN